MFHNFLFMGRTGLKSTGLKCGVRKTFPIIQHIKFFPHQTSYYSANINQINSFSDTLLDAKAMKRDILMIQSCAIMHNTLVTIIDSFAFCVHRSAVKWCFLDPKL